MSSTEMTRRGFLSASTGAVAALGASTLLAQAPRGPNERLSIGIIGTGDRGRALMGELQGLSGSQNVEITALCDVWRVNLEAAAARAREGSGRTPRTFTRFQELLALDDVDAVVIATPDFLHIPILIAALKAGKDVYVEKPMAVEMKGLNEALDLAREGRRVVQVGTQRRSDGAYKAAAREFASGVLGTVSRVSTSINFNHARWGTRSYENCREADVDWEAYLFNREKRPFDPRLLRQWHLFRDCTNGLAGLWMTHHSDVVHMVTGARYPSAATALGGIYVWKDGREHTDTFTALLDYPEGFLMDWSMSLGSFAGGIQCVASGTEGVMDIERLTLTVKGEGNKPATRKLEREPGESHMGNWLDCIRSRQRPNADIEYGHQHSIATIMVAMALQTGRHHRYDPQSRQVLPV